MVIVALGYILLAWGIFFQFKLLPWSWPWRILTVVIGCAVLGVFLALFNTMTPSGRFAVVGRVVEVTPNVMGTVVAIEVEPNALVKAGSVLFRIDPAPYQAKVKQLRAAVAEAEQKVHQYKAQVDLAVAEVGGLTSQIGYAEKRRDDIEKLARTAASSEFRLQDAVAQVDVLNAQLQAARAREVNARLVLGSEIEGQNTTVAQLQAQLDNAEWELDQTTIRAAADGYVSGMSLSVGARAVPLKAAMSFIVAADTSIIGVFDQAGYVSIRTGTPVHLVFSHLPGHVFQSRMGTIAQGIGQGQVAVSGSLFRAESIGTSSTYPAFIAVPEDLDPAQLRLGIVGTATVVPENSGAIGILASIILWAKAYLAYL
jgi:multidrug resistance efflux pump